MSLQALSVSGEPGVVILVLILGPLIIMAIYRFSRRFFVKELTEEEKRRAGKLSQGNGLSRY